MSSAALASSWGEGVSVAVDCCPYELAGEEASPWGGGQSSSWMFSIR